MDKKEKIDYEKINLESKKIDIRTIDRLMDISNNQRNFVNAAFGMKDAIGASGTIGKMNIPEIKLVKDSLTIASEFAKPATDVSFKIKDSVANITRNRDALLGATSGLDHDFITAGRIKEFGLLNPELDTVGMTGKIYTLGMAGITDQIQTVGMVGTINQINALSKIQSVTGLLSKDVLSKINLDYGESIKTLGTVGQAIDIDLFKFGVISSPAYKTVKDVMDKINFEIPEIDLNLAKGIGASIQDFVEKNPINDYKINQAFNVLAKSDTSFNSALDMDNYLDENLNVNDTFTFEEIKEIVAQWYCSYIKFNNKMADKFEKFIRNNFVIHLMILIIGSLYAKPVMEELAKPVVEKTAIVIKSIFLGEDKNTITIDKDSKVQIIDEEVDHYKVIYTNEKGEEVVCPVEKEHLQILEEK